jgi:fatty-acyl-CoA synthase
MEELELETFCTVYGMTETSGITTMTRPEDAVADIVSSIGFPLPGFKLRYVDPQTHTDVPPGEVGELWVCDQLVMKGYERLIPRTGEEYMTRDGWFKTGDLLVRDADGRHRFFGRIKDIIKVGGENVSASEIELVLREHPAIRDAAVFGVPDESRTEVVAAVIAADSDLTFDDVRDYCRTKLAPFKLPRYVLQVDELPTTSAGKVAKAQLRGIVLEHVASLRAAEHE